jgi:hypothetical protein
MVILCKHCNKEYSSYSSRSNHIKKYHNDDNKQISIKSKPNSQSLGKPNKIETTSFFDCRKCDKIFKFKQSRWKHEKTCTFMKESEIDLIKKEMEDYKKETEAEMERLRDIIQKSLKIHPKTLQKINNQLNNTTNNNITNNTINNNLYVQLGNEDLVNVLSKSEKRGILNRKSMGINDLVELIHCSGKYKQFMNVYITNLQNTVAYCYNEKLNNFIVVNKNELLNDIIDSRIYDITKFLEEAEKVLEPTTAADIKRIIKKMESDDSFKGLKKEEIKFILYNNKDKIMIEKDKLDEMEV